MPQKKALSVNRIKSFFQIQISSLANLMVHADNFHVGVIKRFFQKRWCIYVWKTPKW